MPITDRGSVSCALESIALGVARARACAGVGQDDATPDMSSVREKEGKGRSIRRDGAGSKLVMIDSLMRVSYLHSCPHWQGVVSPPLPCSPTWSTSMSPCSRSLTCPPATPPPACSGWTCSWLARAHCPRPPSSAQRPPSLVNSFPSVGSIQPLDPPPACAAARLLAVAMHCPRECHSSRSLAVRKGRKRG